MLRNSELTREQLESWTIELERRNKQLQDDLTNTALSGLKLDDEVERLKRENHSIKCILSNYTESFDKVVDEKLIIQFNLNAEVKSLKARLDTVKSDYKVSESKANILDNEVKRLSDLYVPDDYCSGTCFDCKFKELDDNGNNHAKCSNCLCNSGIKDHFVKKGENNEI